MPNLLRSILMLAATLASASAARADPIPSWNDGPTKQAIEAFIDDKEGKLVGINQHIGTRPSFASGNSDGDFQMLEWTTASDGPRFGLILHHTDADREYAYDRDSHVGRLDKALDAAADKGWVVIDIKNDWKEVFPPQSRLDAPPRWKKSPRRLTLKHASRKGPSPPNMGSLSFHCRQSGPNRPCLIGHGCG